MVAPGQFLADLDDTVVILVATVQKRGAESFIAFLSRALSTGLQPRGITVFAAFIDSVQCVLEKFHQTIVVLLK